MDSLSTTGETSTGGTIYASNNSNGDKLIITVERDGTAQIDINGAIFLLDRETLARILLTPLHQRILGDTLDDPNWYLT